MKRPATRVCKKCKFEKPIDAFPTYARMMPSGKMCHGWGHTCIDCLRPLPKGMMAGPPPPRSLSVVDGATVVPTDRIPILYGYVRVSTDRQATQGNSLAEQTDRIGKFFALHGPAKGLVWGGVFQDGGVSGFRKPFGDRAAGKVLAARLLPGDHLVATSLDRLFRNFKDAVNTFEAWLDRGIHLHLISDGISTDSHVGRMILRMLAVLAQFQRDTTAEYTRVNIAKLTRDGRMAHQSMDLGWKMVGTRGHRVVVPCHETRRQMLLIAHLADNEGMSFHDIYLYLTERRVIRPPRGPMRPEGTPWTEAWVRHCYREFKGNPHFKRLRYLKQLGLDPDQYDHEHQPLEAEPCDSASST